MAICVEPGLYVRIEELPNGPMPRPLSSGFSPGSAYRVLGMESFSETSETYLMLSNDRDEIWFISNRHVRTCALRPEETRLRYTVAERAWPARSGQAMIERPVELLAAP